MSSAMSKEILFVADVKADLMAVARASVIPLEQLHVPPIMKASSSV